MVLERQIYPYFDWLITGGDSPIGALPRFLLVMLALCLLALALGALIAIGRYGFIRGGEVVYQTVVGGIRELLAMSPRRIGALAKLAVKEAVRRRVAVALGVFFVLLLFANWFLTTNHQEPAKLYLSFVLTATTYLVLGIALLLSAFSLPADFKTKTIYTVVTKPVRAGEIILGRIIGFTIVGTVLLAIMGVLSYIFVVRSLHHAHDVELQSLRNVSNQGQIIGRDGRTTPANGHRHNVELDVDGNGIAVSNAGHTHPVDTIGQNAVVGDPDGFIRARVPKYGKISFIDRSGAPKDRGISVGSEWTYRTFIDGNTQATAIWTFTGVNEAIAEVEAETGEKFLPLTLIVRVFRTHKGNVDPVTGEVSPVSGSIVLRNPENDVSSDELPFMALDAQIDEQTINVKLTNKDNEPIDLFDDLVTDDGRLEVRVKCLDRGMYFGFAQADCYLRLPDGSPAINLVKVYGSIWVQMVIVISFGVAISTLVSGPVAMLFMLGLTILGFFRELFINIATGQQADGRRFYGGGPVESLYRLVTQKNVMTDLPEGPGTTIIQSVDAVFQFLMFSVAQVLPDFRSFDATRYAADGFNMPAALLGQHLTICAAYVVGLTILGYFLLRTREVAR